MDYEKDLYLRQFEYTRQEVIDTVDFLKENWNNAYSGYSKTYGGFFSCTIIRPRTPTFLFVSRYTVTWPEKCRETAQKQISARVCYKKPASHMIDMI